MQQRGVGMRVAARAVLFAVMRVRVSWQLDDFCLPLYVVKAEPSGGMPLEFRGTCFVLPGDIVVTCRHCVDCLLGVDEVICAMSSSGDKVTAHTLLDLSFDPSGADLASARVEKKFDSTLCIARRSEGIGQEVASYGYPGTYGRIGDEIPGKKTFAQHARWLQGYVTRAFQYEPPGTLRKFPAWELDMPAPVGLSGGPLFRLDRIERTIIGVVSGSHPERREPDANGSLLPDYVFALAQHYSTLGSLRGAALGDKTLLQYMDCLGFVTDDA